MRMFNTEFCLIYTEVKREKICEGSIVKHSTLREKYKKRNDGKK